MPKVLLRLSADRKSAENLQNVYGFLVPASAKVVAAHYDPVEPVALTLVFYGEPEPNPNVRWFMVHGQSAARPTLTVSDYLHYAATSSDDNAHMWHVFEVDGSAISEDAKKGNNDKTTDSKTTPQVSPKVIEFKSPSPPKG